MNAPTLLVGLGGCGCKIVNKVSNLISGDKTQNVAIVAFDTDINELREIQEKNPLIRIIQTSTKQTVGEYLNKDTHARDTWFPVNAILNAKTLTEGAGQVRSISRLSLETVIRANKMNPLHEAIQSLYKVEEDKTEQALRVVIVSSLAGGTGSGLILPVAMYIKNYLATHFRQSANITRGFFILPEVFYEVIPGQSEQNNLKANAYATLRELDAFLMKGDETLHKKYFDSVKLQFPSGENGSYEEYSVRPYDFCFLFDAQNADGGKLNSHEQYLDHAANCIYAQSIGPMNKRSNSSEDNTIRKLAKERGRNRYAGAGASMLIYPSEDIKNYIALQWAKESISKQWLTYDADYYALCEENKKREEEGYSFPNPDQLEFYTKAVESGANKNDPFSRAIVRACSTYKPDGVTKQADNWVLYISALKTKIEADVKSGQSGLDSQLKKIDNSFGTLATSNEWEDYVNIYTMADTYRSMVYKYVEETARITAYTMFKASRDYKVKNPESFELEYYLTGTDHNFMHPNAARYFLGKALDLVKKELASAKSRVSALKGQFDTFEHDTFDLADTDVEETAASMVDRKLPLISKLLKRPTSDQEEIRDKIRDYVNKINEYKEKYMLEQVLIEGYKYIEGVLKSFDLFYGTFETKVGTLDKQIADIEKKFVSRVGSTVRYVCADKKCLDAIYSKKHYTGSPIAIDSELARNIYYRVLNYAAMAEKPKNNRYFSDLFDEGILGYFEKFVMDKYGADINIDIITALEREAVYVHPEYNDKDNATTLCEQYVHKVIENSRALSCPFIEYPMGESRETINACTFSKEIEDKAQDDPYRANLIKNELLNFGGKSDADIPINMIMFYQSFYGLRANDLSKFAPPEKSPTYTRSSGEYFKAYYSLVEGIHPETHLSKGISPHIDRWWHIITKMPDLDEDNQARQEHDINAAFFWGILCKYIDLYEESPDHKVYKLDKEELEMDNDTMIVSNGTACDKLYEVLDAVAIYPELTHKICKRVELKSEDDLNKNRALEHGILIRNLDRFSMSEPGLGAEDHLQPATSIFSIPLLMKKSSTPDMYFEESVVQILKDEIDEIKKYLTKFCTEKELPTKMGEILKVQYQKYLQDMAVEKESYNALYRESLFGQTCAIIAKTFEKLGFEETSRDVRDKADELKKQ